MGPVSDVPNAAGTKFIFAFNPLISCIMLPKFRQSPRFGRSSPSADLKVLYIQLKTQYLIFGESARS